MERRAHRAGECPARASGRVRGDRAAGLRNVASLVRPSSATESDARLPDLARQVLRVLAEQVEQLQAAVAARWNSRLTGLAQEQPCKSASGDHPRHRADHRHRDCRDGRGGKRVPQRSRVCGVAGPGAAAALDRRQGTPWRHLQARQPVFATSADQRRERQSAALEGDQCRSLGDRAAPPKAAGRRAVAWRTRRPRRSGDHGRRETYQRRAAAEKKPRSAASLRE